MKLIILVAVCVFALLFLTYINENYLVGRGYFVFHEQSCSNNVEDYPYEDAVDCGGECPSCTNPAQGSNGGGSSSGGSSGGGGGVLLPGTTIEPQFLNCQPQLQCSNWSLCDDNNTQSRICTDAAQCLAPKNQQRSCTANCTDGITNGDETGIDCGGICNPCLDQPRKLEEKKLLAETESSNTNVSWAVISGGILVILGGTLFFLMKFRDYSLISWVRRQKKRQIPDSMIGNKLRTEGITEERITYLLRKK